MGHKETEQAIFKFWKDRKIFEKSIKQRPSDKPYVFYDGPPFATGLPHYGHILGLTSKDLFPRFWTMKGYRCERRWGWDCHGLPIENIAEKELGIKHKAEIKEKGIDKFNEFCCSKVLFFASEWKKMVDRISKWIEFDNSYKTMDRDYMESVWAIFKKLYDEKLIYEGKKILLYCPRCETPVSKFEIAMDKSYKDITEKSITVKFKLKNEDAYVLAWTTTPWTLVGNVALAVNSKLDYVKIKINSENLILAKELLKTIKQDYKIVSEFKGKELVNNEYEPVYGIDSDKKAHYIIDGGKEVSSAEGTGIVHIACYGEFDFDMITKYSLPVIQHISDDGKLTQGPEQWKGMWFKKLDPLVIEELEKRNLLFSAENHVHSYPFCYRCDTPLFYNAVNSWFVDIQSVKPKLLEKAKEISWYPKKVETMFKYIIKTAPDWTISRNRFWATAIPIWVCGKCSEKKVIGSINELKSHAVEKVPENIDLHKHVVDNIHLKCPKCSSAMTRIPEVIDCWFESASMPYAVKHYPFENKEWFKLNYPADFVSEYIAQVRAWYYYMHVLGVLVFNKAPFRNVVVTGNLLASDGTKMSKSKKNFPDPNLTLDKYGSDTLRFYLMSSPLMRAEDANFNEESLKEIYRRVHILLSNVKTFYELFAKNNKNLNSISSKNILDRWVINRINALMINVTNCFEKYNTITACSEIMAFIDDLSTWYVRRSRDRFKEGDKDAQKTLAYVLLNLAKIMAPITPVISEDIYLMLAKSKTELPESVHLNNWPKPGLKPDEKLDEKMRQTRKITSLALEKREKSKIPVRQVLSSVEVTGIKLSKDYLDIIKNEINVKKVVLKPGKKVSVKLSTKITRELLKEGISRDLIRKINDFRKKLNLTISNRIVLYVETSDRLINESVAGFKKEIMNAVQADKLEFKIPENTETSEAEINGVRLRTGIKVITK